LQSIEQLILKNLKKSDHVEEGIERWGESETGRIGGVSDFFLLESPSLPIPDSPHLLTPSQLAAACAIPVKYERLPFAFGRVVYLAEASLQPLGITVNLTAIEKITNCALEVPDEYRVWFSAAALSEIIVAHELYHILAQQPSSRVVEIHAHNFAQALTGLPFAPTVFEEILRQTTE
jgi:hypothetical protein